MKTKITLLIAGCVFALASIMFAGEDVATESDLMSKNIEALSQGGEFDGFQQGYTSDTKKKIVSSSFQSTILGGVWYYEYEEVPCCRVSNPVRLAMLPLSVPADLQLMAESLTLPAHSTSTSPVTS